VHDLITKSLEEQGKTLMLKLLDWLFNLLAAIAVFLMGAALLSRFLETPPWVAGVALCIVAIGLYLGNVILIRSYILNRAPALAHDHAWELTAATEIVPKWVSFLGLLSFPALIAAGIWFFAWYWPK
jgi:hypothetical protein